MRDKKFAIAIVIIVVLALGLAYVALVRPQIGEYMTAKQVEGYNIAINNLIQTVDQQGVAQIPVSESVMIVCQGVQIDQNPSAVTGQDVQTVTGE